LVRRRRIVINEERPMTQPIGAIVKLQVQVRSLKVPGPRFRAYDPAGLVDLPRLTLSEGGVAGFDSAGNALPDVHHRDHPSGKYRGENPISIGFTSHYRAMRERFGGHLVDGIAGENILIESDRMWRDFELAEGIVLETASGERLRLEQVIVATPCVEFARWALRYPEEERPDASVEEAVRFLNDGMRGFYATYSGPEAPLAVGERAVLGG
jgi:hypothetical protein